ncbi:MULTISPECIES: helix-turn-helix domain-containing protein [unclassified Paenibacillus]|uniref:helix-turn-helix domain-containing protein n=1 Tax=unclassified Paenibacillus TaxID=185978 RepID=UPI000575AD9B|nr:MULTISPECIES: helix-turn-helix transcriptional regulator [unclassified Paenibacillus]KHL91177.1 XRE family transcriptional regulator [Paenibacillus sp. IHB B 3415]OMF28844.1 transcriptional regulator [Paenibacillus sp. FSL H8-0259]
MPDESKSELVQRIGERIRRVRKEINLSQEQLAERSGLHTNYVGQVERGEKNLTLETLEKVVGGLGISLEELFRYIGPMKQKDAISQIVELLIERPSADQEMALSVLKSVLDWEEKKHDL